MRCTDCNEDIPAVVTRCPSCGHPTARTTALVAQARPPADRHTGLVAAGAVCAALGAFMLPLLAVVGIVLGVLAHRRGDARGRLVVLVAFAGLVLGIASAYLYGA